MNHYYVEIAKLPVLGVNDGKVGGESRYSRITRYGCQCAGGEIVRYDSGNELGSFVVVKCAECLKKLRPFAEIEGEYFRLTLL